MCQHTSQLIVQKTFKAKRDKNKNVCWLNNNENGRAAGSDEENCETRAFCLRWTGCGAGDRGKDVMQNIYI